ncbi:MAG: CHASE sensor domain-containing protein [Pseudomonadota bacterium]
MRAWYSRLPIADKIRCLLMAIGLVCVLSFGGIGLYYGSYSVQKTFQEEALNTVRLIGERNVAALRFNNPDFTRENLKTIEDSSYLQICIYDKSQKIFALYSRIDDRCVGPDLRADGLYKETIVREGGRTLISKNIIANGEIVGAIALLRDELPVRNYIKTQLKVIGILVLISMLICYFAANFLQRIVSRPIVDIANHAQSIVHHSDFGSRLTRTPSDELGKVVEAFNHVLGIMQTKLSEVTQQLDDSKQANQMIIKKVGEIGEDFVDTAGSFLVYSDLTSQNIFGPMVSEYLPYQLDVLESMQVHNVKIDAIKRLSELYARAINTAPVYLNLSSFIQDLTKQYKMRFAFVKTDSLACIERTSGLGISVYKEAWDELFRIAQQLLTSYLGTIDFAARIYFDFDVFTDTLTLSLLEDSPQPAAAEKKHSAILDLIKSLSELDDFNDEESYAKNSIHDPDAANEFLSDESMDRSQLLYILDSISYIANANRIAVSHQFHTNRFNLCLKLATVRHKHLYDEKVAMI